RCFFRREFTAAENPSRPRLPGSFRRSCEAGCRSQHHGGGSCHRSAQAEEIVASGKADLVALARAMLYDPRWGWHAAAELGASVFAPPQYWRSQPSTQKSLFGATTFGTR